MLGLPPTVRIHFAVGLVDMRKGIDGLRAIVDGVLKRDPYEGHLFVFVGKLAGVNYELPSTTITSPHPGS
jgi:transposase